MTHLAWWPYIVLAGAAVGICTGLFGVGGSLVATPVLALAAWLILVFVAAREPRRRGAAGITSLPQQPPAHEQQREAPERKAA